MVLDGLGVPRVAHHDTIVHRALEELAGYFLYMEKKGEPLSVLLAGYIVDDSLRCRPTSEGVCAD